jgi:metal-responsive CopG/Arc/MetJ family transcriptional regulator
MGKNKDNYMTVEHKVEKITVTIPKELKEHLLALKDEIGTSMSSIYKDALQSYIAQKEQERWAKAARLMEERYTNDPELKEWIEFEEDTYGYPSS